MQSGFWEELEQAVVLDITREKEKEKKKKKNQSFEYNRTANNSHSMQIARLG